MNKSDQSEEKLECLGFWCKHALLLDALDAFDHNDDNPIGRLLEEKCFGEKNNINIDTLYEVMDQAEKQARKLTAECVKSACEVIKKSGLVKYKEPSNRSNRDAWYCETGVLRKRPGPANCNVVVGCWVETEGQSVSIVPFLWMRKQIANGEATKKIRKALSCSEILYNDEGGTTLVLKAIPLEPDRSFGLNRASINKNFENSFRPLTKALLDKIL